MERKKLIKEPYTMYPNQLLDRIRIKLTDTEKAVIDVVVRLTYGWQSTSARISNATFAQKSGKSERAIINAKHKLLQLGLLVQLEPARSTNPALYTIDLYYNDPKRRMERPQSDTQSIEQPPDDLLSSIGESAPNSTLPDLQVTPELPSPTEASTQDNVTIIHEDTPPSATIEIPVHSDKETATEAPQACTDKTLGNSDNEDRVDAVLATNQEKGCTATDAPHFSALSSSLNIYNKQTTENAPNKQPATHAVQAGIRDVCYKFISIFPEAKEDSTYKFIGWCVSNYGQDKCIEKLEYLREYRKLHPIVNPKGLLRVALTKDYVPGRWIAGMIKARRKADLAYQQSQSMLAEMKASRENIDYEAGAAAIKSIIKMLEEKEKSE